MRVLNSVEVESLGGGDLEATGSPAAFVAIGKGVVCGVYSYLYDTKNFCAFEFSLTTAQCHFYHLRASIFHGVIGTTDAVFQLRR